MPRLLISTIAVVSAIPGLALAQGARLNEFGNPARVAPAPTAATITPRDLQIRLYQFADDSMHGRQVGRIGNHKGTAMIAAEAKRLGLIPAGDNGTYFQVLPFHIKKYTDHSRLTVEGNPLRWEHDWVAVPGARAPRAIDTAQVIFGGVEGDTTRQISAAQAAGKFVVLLPSPPSAAGRGGRGGGGGRGGFPAAPSRFADAAAVATINLDGLSSAARQAINNPTVAQQTAPVGLGGGGRGGRGGRGGAAPPPPVDSLTLYRQAIGQLMPAANIRLTRSAASALFGRPVDGLQPGATGGKVTASLEFVELPSEWARNVVAIIPGSDPALKGQYVAIGSHNDHVGFGPTTVDHDSLKAWNNERNKLLLANDMRALDSAKLASIRVNMDSVRRLNPRPRLDSIRNGADDDGSGSMAMLEIAEAIQAMRVKPKRSTLFVWHTGEEAGLLGSRFFTRNPTVPIDSIVAQINMDMIGRGRLGDIPGGGSDYLGVVGSFFDSKDLGETVVAVNKKQAKPFALDYRYDTTLTWSGYNNIYGRSDHYNYALQGIPIAFFFTGLHGDYHQNSDEPQYIDYPHYSSIVNYIRELSVEVANGPRPRMNGTNPAKPPRPIVP